MCNIMEIQIHSIEEYNNLQKDMKTFNKIKSIIFMYEFNNIINIFPKSVISIKFGSCYNQLLPSLQNTKLKSITFGYNYNQPLPSLQNTNIKSITFGEHYNQPLPSLQNTKLKSITFGDDYNQSLPPLQNTNIKYIKIGISYNQQLPDLRYTNVKTIVFGFYDELFNKLYSQFSHKINLPYSHKIFILKESYNIGKHNNEIFDIVEIRNAYIIMKILNPYLYYIIYNKTYIPFEIYNYIYHNYNFTYAN